MSQIEVPKITQLVAIGPDSDELSVTKIVMTALLIPGDGGGGPDTSNKQGHVYVQIVGG